MTPVSFSTALRNSTLDLTAEQLATTRGIFARLLPGSTVWAFGSRVTGRAKPTSDLDLCIVSHGPLSTRELESLRSAFEESSLPMKVDLVEWARLSLRFRALVERHHAVLVVGRHG